MKTLGNIRKKLKNKKGFTLIELIVVIVIIGILAAILVPSVLKYIDKAKEKQVVADGRTVYTAAAGVIAEKYETEPVADKAGVEVTNEDIDENEKTDLVKLIATDAGITRTYTVKFDVEDNKIKDGTFTIEEGGKTATYDGSVWTVEKATTEP
ncbi:MAG TPA: prepilin-type N-terminal cleavage/methylation domain-containing protein [Candidatus Dorea intestinavium]|nr:prepilin-type N-terminal cleavage/methylation domain-containing protein [Candidatus Dorea intestinavium]